MLTPSDIHYLVSILMTVSQTGTVEMELGSLLYDEMAEINRDIDVTIKYIDRTGKTNLFIGVEVKAGTDPLDVQMVEQLIFKAVKIPEIDEINIVSASGFTGSARNLARNCDGNVYGRKCRVKLYHLQNWVDNDLFQQFKFLPGTTFDEWVVEWNAVEECYMTSTDENTILPVEMIFDSTGKPLITLESLFEQSCRQWLSQVKYQIPVGERNPEIPIQVEADVFFTNELFSRDRENSGELVPLKKITIVGEIVWRKFGHEITRKALISIEEQQQPVAGAMLGTNLNGDILCFAVSKENRSLSHFLIPAEYRQKKKIQRLAPLTPQPFNITPL